MVWVFSKGYQYAYQISTYHQARYQDEATLSRWVPSKVLIIKSLGVNLEHIQIIHLGTFWYLAVCKESFTDRALV